MVSHLTTIYKEMDKRMSTTTNPFAKKWRQPAICEAQNQQRSKFDQDAAKSNIYDFSLGQESKNKYH